MPLYFFFVIALFSPFSLVQAAQPAQAASSINIQNIPQQVRTVETNPSEDGYKLPKVENVKRYKKGGLLFDRLARSYIYQIPFIAQDPVQQNQFPINTNYSLKNAPKEKDGKYPLIILLHAGGQGPEQVWEQTTIPEFAYANNYFLVAPEGYQRQWNDGNKKPLAGQKKSYVDDVGFIMVLIENLSTHYPVDSSRVFVVGISNGGFMATHLACRTRDLIHGGANLLSTLSYKDSRSCSNQPLPWLSMNSGADKMVPFLGNIDGSVLDEEPLMSAEETFSFFSSKNRCMKISGYNQLPHFKENDKTLAFIKVASHCHNNTQNVLLGFKNAGHQIPNMRSEDKPFEGLSNQDIDPGTAIINFFNNNLEAKEKN